MEETNPLYALYEKGLEIHNGCKISAYLYAQEEFKNELREYLKTAFDYRNRVPNCELNR